MKLTEVTVKQFTSVNLNGRSVRNCDCDKNEIAKTLLESRSQL